MLASVFSYELLSENAENIDFFIKFLSSFKAKESK